MKFEVGDKVILYDGVIGEEIRTIVLGQVKNYVALATDDYIEVYEIFEFNGNKYLATMHDGAPNPSYEFRIEKN